jgi:hypothetical protein
VAVPDFGHIKQQFTQRPSHWHRSICSFQAVFSVLFDVKDIEVDVSKDDTSNPEVRFVDKGQWPLVSLFKTSWIELWDYCTSSGWSHHQSSHPFEPAAH